MLKNIVMATTLTAGIVSAMADSPDFTRFVESKVIAAFFFVLFFILAGWERLAETTAGKKIETFFESIIDNIIEFCCLFMVGGAMLIGIFVYAIIITPITAGFVLWLMVKKVYKKIFS